jgi:hypothetical protein
LTELLFKFVKNLKISCAKQGNNKRRNHQSSTEEKRAVAQESSKSEGQNGPMKSPTLPENKQNDLLRPPVGVVSSPPPLSSPVSTTARLPVPPATPLPEIRGAMWRSCVSRGLSRAKASASRLLSTASVRLIHLTPLDRSVSFFVSEILALYFFLCSLIVEPAVRRCSDGWVRLFGIGL